ncbi:MAG: hypothetical protein RR719_07090 [Akkermansia sp.]
MWGFCHIFARWWYVRVVKLVVRVVKNDVFDDAVMAGGFVLGYFFGYG